MLCMPIVTHSVTYVSTRLADRHAQRDLRVWPIVTHRVTYVSCFNLR
ncbi:hypothetical protein TBK1r_54990 [Stieleria magnilauensis]|uniref:Uncharacterized protein n=1 Tax=Stieleria magnilauensis TaxID=2527963 RepID=A0ABX5XYG9_9BACT|nr:hypothetical protein TBK1r_54990 [Planctomycetes bacterium TBK1r]